MAYFFTFIITRYQVELLALHLVKLVDFFTIATLKWAVNHRHVQISPMDDAQQHIANRYKTPLQLEQSLFIDFK